MKTLSEVWTEHNRFFDDTLRKLYVQDKVSSQSNLFDAMSYSLNAGGKRLRPFLINLFCDACNGNAQKALPAEIAIELIHTYSLIHDDLPAMDNDDYRRGKLTNHKVFGEASAILAGDGLLTDAFRILSEELPPKQAIACIQILSRAAGPNGMVGGQALDISAEDRLCTEQEVIDIQSMKTGALIVAACQMGVACAQGSQEAFEAAFVFGSSIGLAFQIRDDMLDVIGNLSELGKEVGKDSEKNTFVKLYGLDRCNEIIKEQTNIAVNALNVFSDAHLLKELAEQIAVRNK